MQAETNYALHLVSTYEEINERTQQVIKNLGIELQKIGYKINSYENLLRQTVTPGPDIKETAGLPKIWVYIYISSRGEKALISRFRGGKRTDAIVLAAAGVSLIGLPEGIPIIHWDENNLEAIAYEIHLRIPGLASPVPGGTGFETMRAGAGGETVAAIQQMLKKTIMPNLAADGIYGPATREAVKAFQRKYDLNETGEVNDETFKRLEEIVRKSDLPPEGTTFEPESEQDTRQPSNWLLKLNPATWAIPDLVTGQETWFHSHDLQSKKRSEYDLFQKIAPGDIVLGYATEPIEKVVCTFRVEQGLHTTNLGEGIMLKIDRVLKPPLSGTAVERILGTDAPLSITADVRLLAISSEQLQAILNTTAEGQKIAAIYLASSKFFIRDNIEPTLGVTDIATEVAELIRNLRNNTSDKGRMVGIFGNWGRGKTFLAGQVFKVLENDPFIRVDFHAWKYQDTHASWAYLYEAIARKYFEKPKTITSFFGKLWFDIRKRFRLNLMRRGSAPLVRLGFSVLVTLIAAAAALSFSGKTEFYMKAFWMLLTTAGFADAARLLIRYVRENKIKERATEVFKQYYEKPSFKDLLGVQAEIQGELRNLLRSWVGNEKSPDYGKQLLLFVDDIDRCSEDRMVQLIDALRVMLDDEAISSRVIVVAAIDERVLRRAIKWKYKELLDADRMLDKTENGDISKWDETTLQITSEYMDKLFIAGIKLGTLTKKERQDVFKQLSKEKVVAKPEETITKKKEETSPISSGAKPIPLPNNAEKVTPLGGAPPAGGTPSVNPGIDPEPTNSPVLEALSAPKTPVTDMHFSWEEHEYMLQLVEKLSDATPRQIRIFYYRYLLARNLLTIGMRQNGAENAFETQERNALLGKLLVHYTNTHSNEKLQADRRELQSATMDMSNISINNLITGHADALVNEILETLEMVIAY
jgi:peptidoglycan hydrolase-like protein with peptidoglycan-binding domain